MKRIPRRKYKATKYCNDCKKNRKIALFTMRSGEQSGMHMAFCKPCMNIRQITWRIENKDRYNLYQLKYRKTHEQKKTTK